MTEIKRRVFVGGLAASVAAACSSAIDTALPGTTTSTESADTSSSSTSDAVDSTATTTPETQPAVDAPAFDGAFPFALGVAAGDPDHESAVIWTRLMGASTSADYEVAYDVALDDEFRTIVVSDLASMPAADVHTTRTIASGLTDGTEHFYRFRVGEHTSPVGRFRTTPATGTDGMKIAFSSCQHFESGAWAAHKHMANEDADITIWLGDYMYVSAPGDEGVATELGPRIHRSPEPFTIDHYRDRYAQYKQDPHLQNHHASRAWLITWDDNETSGGYAGMQGFNANGSFEQRRAAAYRAWWEHMPTRASAPDGPNLKIYHSVKWGELAAFHVLDGRQYRDPQPTDGAGTEVGGRDIGIYELSDTARDPNHQMLGVDQHNWLVDGISNSQTTWNVLANQVYMFGLATIPGSNPSINHDSWDGYHGARERLLTESNAAERNLLVLTGDFHAGAVADIKTDPFVGSSPVVATEFMAPAVSSLFPDSYKPLTAVLQVFNPHVHQFTTVNGYMTATLTNERCEASIHMIEDVRDENSGKTVSDPFIVNAGTPGIAS